MKKRIYMKNWKQVCKIWRLKMWKKKKKKILFLGNLNLWPFDLNHLPNQQEFPRLLHLEKCTMNKIAHLLLRGIPNRLVGSTLLIHPRQHEKWTNTKDLCL